MNNTKRNSGKMLRERLIGIILALYTLLNGILGAVGIPVWISAFSGDPTPLAALALLTVGTVASAAGSIFALFRRSARLFAFGLPLVCHVALLAMSVAFSIFGAPGLILIILNLIVLVIGGTFCAYCSLRAGRSKKTNSNGGVRSAILAMGTVSLILTLLLFVTPFCFFSAESGKTLLIPLMPLFGKSSQYADIVLFAVLSALAVGEFTVYLHALETAPGQDFAFAGRMKKVVYLGIGGTAAYLVGGAVYSTFFSKIATPALAFSILPFLGMVAVSVRFSLILRKLGASGLPDPSVSGKGDGRLEFFLYGTVLSLITVGASLSDILKVRITEPQPIENVLLLNGFKATPHNSDGAVAPSDFSSNDTNRRGLY